MKVVILCAVMFAVFSNNSASGRSNGLTKQSLTTPARSILNSSKFFDEYNIKEGKWLDDTLVRTTLREINSHPDLISEAQECIKLSHGEKFLVPFSYMLDLSALVELLEVIPEHLAWSILTHRADSLEDTTRKAHEIVDRLQQHPFNSRREVTLPLDDLTSLLEILSKYLPAKKDTVAVLGGRLLSQLGR